MPVFPRSPSSPMIGYAEASHLRVAVRPMPRPLYGQNLRNELGKYRWSRYREALIKARGVRCETCGKKPKKSLHAHEEWSYEWRKDKGVAVLHDIRLCCWHCHMFEHFALVLTLSPILPRAKSETIRHFCRVNKMTKLDFMNHYFDSIAEWQTLSNKTWSVNFGKFWPLIANKRAGSAFTIPIDVL